jgi:hypothetical protein
VHPLHGNDRDGHPPSDFGTASGFAATAAT